MTIPVILFHREEGRSVKIHEYQAKELFGEFGIAVPSGEVAHSPEEAEKIAEDLGKVVVVKAQVHAGGRGKAGGIKLANNPKEAKEKAKEILGMNIKGLIVKKVLVEEAFSIAEENYLAIILDRSTRRHVLMASTKGGVDIEEVAAQMPEKIAKLYLDPAKGVLDYQLRTLFFEAGMNPAFYKEFLTLSRSFVEAYFTCDGFLFEINPLVFTKDCRLFAADAKIDIDENALFRQNGLSTLRESSEEDPIEQEAHRRRLPYVHLPGGNVGIIGNGAGLVMTTLDMVAREGGKPSNFLDVGGGANSEIVRSAMEVVLMDKNVKGIFVNIFGGITRCDEVAKGLIEARASLKLNLPMVIRLSGTLDEEGRAILAKAGLPSVETMEDGAKKIVELVNGKN